MSAVFGAPPPPPPTVLQGSSAFAARQPAPPPRRVDRRDPHPWRRRAVSLLALAAATLLLLAHLSTWLHFQVLDSSASAPPAAAASVERVRADAVALATPGVERQVRAAYARSGTPVPATLGDDVGRAVQGALESDTFTDAWQAALAGMIDRLAASVEHGRPLGAGEEPVRPDTFDLAPVSPEVRDRLAAGYPFLGGSTLEVGQVTLPATTTDDVPYDLLRTLDSLWWLFLLGGVVLAALAVAWAPLRLRLAGLLAADVVLLLAVGLLTVPLVGRAVGDVVVDPDRAALLEDAWSGLARGFVVRTVVLMVLAAAAAVTCLVLARRERGPARA